jgi:hypothetical protein
VFNKSLIHQYTVVTRLVELARAGASTHCLLVLEHVSHQQSCVVRKVLIWTASSSHDIGRLVENVENVSREVNDI